jgi:hypothetical protein
VLAGMPLVDAHALNRAANAINPDEVLAPARHNKSSRPAKDVSFQEVEA